MADKKITQLTNITGANLVDADEFVVVDISADETKAITLGELKEAFDSGSGFVRITGDTMTGDLALSGADVTFGDNDKAIFGAGSDLQIYHDGSQSFVQENGTGQLVLDTQNGARVKLTSNNGTENMVVANKDGDVELYYDNAQKLATTSTGIDVTGEITADGLTVDGTINGDALELDGAPSAFGSTSSTAYILKTGSGGSAPFNQAGALVYQPRTSITDGRSNHLFYTGDPLALRMNIQPNGDITFYDTLGNASFVYDESAGSTFNEQGDNKDFRVESNDHTHMLFVDASQNTVGIGEETTPSAGVRLHVSKSDSSSYTTDGVSLQNDVPVKIQNLNTSDNNVMSGIHIRSGTWDGGIVGVPLGNGTNNNGFLALVSEGQEAARFYNDGAQGGTVFNDNSFDRDFRVESDANANMLVVDAGNSRVGIGRNNPSYTFHVEGVVASEHYMRVDSNSGVNGSSLLTLKRNGNTAGDYLQMRDGSNNLFATFDEGGIIFNEGGANTDFRVESDTETHALFVDAGTNTVGINTSDVDSSSRLTVSGKVLLKKTDDGVGLRHIGGNNSQGTSDYERVVGHYPVVNTSTGGTKLIIPFVSQGNLNSNTIIRIMGTPAIWNLQATSRAFTAEIAVAHLTSLQFSVLHSTGNVSSVTVSGMNLEINFTNAYRSATADGLYATIEFMTNVPSYSIDVDSITMN